MECTVVLFRLEYRNGSIPRPLEKALSLSLLQVQDDTEEIHLLFKVILNTIRINLKMAYFR